MEDAAELVFIATPFMGHMVAQVELAKHLLAHLRPRISIPILIPKLPIPEENLDAYLRSATVDDRISFVELPPLAELSSMTEELRSKRPFALIDLLARLYKPVVKRVLETRGRRTVGILVDMLATRFVEVAEDMSVPSYVLFTSGANLLSMMLELEARGVDAPSASAVVEVPGFRNTLPTESWPEICLDKANVEQFLLQATRYRKTKGILVNTFSELESDLLRSLFENQRCPPIYSIGPTLHLGRRVSGVEQIAAGIERSGHRFVWSLRPQPSPDNDDYGEVLPAGFLERTGKVGKMIGWAPQAEVLAHPAVGAFVSHCGWNSVLESLWFGVPVVAWPMYGEQQLNAFSLVRELGIAVEVRMGYRYDLVARKGNVVVAAEEVERAVRRMMEEEEGEVVRKKVKEMSELAKKALDVGGSSDKSLRCFAQYVMKNVS